MSKRFRFGEFAWGPRGPALEIFGWDDDHNTLVLGLVAFTLYLKIPMLFIKGYDVEKGYGFSFTHDSLHLHWNERSKVLWYPWTWNFVRRWELVDGGSYASGRQFWIEIPRAMNHGEVATNHEADYTYVLRSGEKQERKATFYVDMMEWRPRWLMWQPWIRKRSQSIWVTFNAEVGERTGSWKGGTLGCGYEIWPGETPLDTLRRMEKERTFN